MSLLHRFLTYSLRHQRPIRVMLLAEDGGLKHMNLTVQEMDETGILYVSARNKKTPRRLLFSDLLGASYARGDDGDTLRKADKTCKS